VAPRSAVTGHVPPVLWLHCGRCCQCERRCGRPSRLARITPPADPDLWPAWHPQRIANGGPLPGDDYILQMWHRDVAYEIRVGQGGSGFVHLLTCLRCKPTEGPATRAMAGREFVAPAPPGFVHRIGQERATRMWDGFLATREAGNVIHLPLSR
jgi:hypothetical protein